MAPRVRETGNLISTGKEQLRGGDSGRQSSIARAPANSINGPEGITVTWDTVVPSLSTVSASKHKPGWNQLHSRDNSATCWIL